MHVNQNEKKDIMPRGHPDVHWLTKPFNLLCLFKLDFNQCIKLHTARRRRKQKNINYKNIRTYCSLQNVIVHQPTDFHTQEIRDTITLVHIEVGQGDTLR